MVLKRFLIASKSDEFSGSSDVRETVKVITVKQVSCKTKFRSKSPISAKRGTKTAPVLVRDQVTEVLQKYSYFSNGGVIMSEQLSFLNKRIHMSIIQL